MAPLVVLHQDPYILAVSKPAGLLIQANAAGGPTLEAAVRSYLAPDAPGSVYLGTVHRLDRPVSGVVVWALTPKAARRLAGQFERRTTNKEYWALVEPSGDVAAPGSQTTWRDRLAPHSDARGVVAVRGSDDPDAREAITQVERPASDLFPVPPGLAGLVLRPETGRTHQLRAQAAARGMPVWGDAAYGSTRAFVDGAIALHARSLRFVHPGSLETMRIEAPLPDAWRGVGEP